MPNSARRTRKLPAVARYCIGTDLIHLSRPEPANQSSGRGVAIIPGALSVEAEQRQPWDDESLDCLVERLDPRLRRQHAQLGVVRREVHLRLQTPQGWG